MELHETRMGAAFFNGQPPRLIKALETIGENLKKRPVEQTIADTSSIASFLAEGWRFVGVFSDNGQDYIIVEREIITGK